MTKMLIRCKYPLRQAGQPKIHPISLAYYPISEEMKYKRNIHISMTKLSVDCGGPLHLAAFWRIGYF